MAAHFLVDAVKVFLASSAAPRQAFAFQTSGNRSLYLGKNFFSVAAHVFHGSRNSACTHRIKRGKTQFFKLDSNGIHSQPISDGGIDIKSFSGDASALVWSKHIQRAHIVKTVGDFNQDYAQILRHGHRHFLKILCLCFGATTKSYLVEFAYTVNQISNRIAKLRLNCCLGNAGVFDYVVQHSGHQALMVHVHFAENAGYC